MQRSQHRRDRHGRPAAERGGHLQQHRQHEHGRLQAAAGRVPGPALPERRAAGRAVLRRRHGGADRHPDRRRREGRLGLPHHRAGRADPHRATATTWRSTAAASSRSCCPRARPPTPAPATSRSTPRASWSPTTATSSSRRSPSREDATDVIDLQDRPGAGRSPATTRAAGRRPARARHLRQRGRPGGDRRQPVHGDRRLRRGHHRRARRSGLRRADARATPRPPTSTR